MVYQLLNSQNQKYPNRLIKLSPANFVKIEFGSGTTLLIMAWTHKQDPKLAFFGREKTLSHSLAPSSVSSITVNL